MTHDAEQYLLHEMDKEDFMDLQKIGHVDELLDSVLYLDEDADSIDDDNGLLFPQPKFKGE